MELFKKTPGHIGSRVRHVAVTTEGVPQWAQQHKLPLEEAYKLFAAKTIEAIQAQLKMDIPMMTLYMLRSDMQDIGHFSARIDALASLFTELSELPLIHDNRIKISTFGKWYDLPSRIVEPIKKMAEATKEHDRFFVNFCVYYDGQEEIVDACKIIAMQVKNGKIDIDAVTKQQIKENIYTSDFLPPDIIIKNGISQQLNGILLWDSAASHICFTRKNWLEFTADDFRRAIQDFESKKI